MKKSEIEQAVYSIIQKYGKILKNTSKRSYGLPESLLPYDKTIIKNAIKVALTWEDNEDMRGQLKSGYIALANFIPDREAESAEDVSQDLFSFLELGENEKKDFLQARFKSGLLGDYEIAVQLTSRIAAEQKLLREEIEGFVNSLNQGKPDRTESKD